MDVSTVVQDLRLDQVGPNAFRGHAPQPHPVSTRVFGGHVLAQALLAAGRTLPDGRLPQSLHAYFIRPGDFTGPLDFSVVRHRDGGALSARRVVVSQQGETILELMMTAGPRWPEITSHDPMPQVPGPEKLSPVQEQLAPYADEWEGWFVRPRPFDLHYPVVPPRLAADGQQDPGPRSQVWVRARGDVPDDPLMQRCLLAYASDQTILDPVLTSRWGTVMPGAQNVASLDHSMWFHAEPDVSKWLLFDQSSSAGTARTGLARGHVYRQDGRLVCTVAQEGLIRSSALR